MVLLAFFSPLNGLLGRQPADMPEGGSASTRGGRGDGDAQERVEWAGGEQRRGSRRSNMTRDKLYELVDAVCIPGAASSTDDKPLHQRFAMAACGKSGSSTSGFTELDKKRKLADVAKEYESVQAYQCSSCRRTLAAGLAIRPPSESQRLYIPGPKVASALPGHELDHVVAVYTATHSHALEKAGYMRLIVHHFEPETALPRELVPLDVHAQGSAQKKAKRGSSLTVSAAAVDDAQTPVSSSSQAQPLPPPPGADDSESRAAQAELATLSVLTMPPEPPDWSTRQDLVTMMESPFYIKNKEGSKRGPYTPVYLWPHGKQFKGVRTAYGGAWAKGDASDRLRHLYQDYYNMTVREETVLEQVRLKDASVLSLRESKLPQGLRSTIRVTHDFPLPSGTKTWHDAVVNHLKTHLEDKFIEPSEFNKKSD